jgi:ABC-2 type transport system ATP-binding protein
MIHTGSQEGAVYMENTSHADKQCIISTSRLTKAFGPLVAVNDLQLQVMRGDVFGFLGRNGSGKTTTIRMLLGLIRPTAGHIQIFGMDADKQRSAILPRIGAIIETPVFYPYLSGIDNLRAIAASSTCNCAKSIISASMKYSISSIYAVVQTTLTANTRWA